MPYKYYSRVEGDVTVLYQVNMQIFRYCSYWHTFHNAYICGIAGLPNKVKSWVYNPDEVVTISCAELDKMTLVDEKTKGGARKAVKAYYRKGDIWSPYGDLVRGGTWLRSCPKIHKI